MHVNHSVISKQQIHFSLYFYHNSLQVPHSELFKLMKHRHCFIITDAENVALIMLWNQLIQWNKICLWVLWPWADTTPGRNSIISFSNSFETPQYLVVSELISHPVLCNVCGDCTCGAALSKGSAGEDAMFSIFTSSLTGSLAASGGAELYMTGAGA